MPTSYTSLLGLALPVTGELSGTWGDTVNDYITQYLDASVAGTQTISGSQTAVTLSKTTATSLSQAGSSATGSSQYNIINCTGNPASMLTVTVPAASKTYVVVNATSTNQDVKIVGAGPTTGVTLVAGEKAVIAWNGSDFIKVATSTADGVTTLSFGSTGLTPSTATSGAVTVAGTLVAANGGTGQSSYTTGDLLYATGSTALSKLGIGTNGQILTSTGTAPQWSTLSGVAVTTFSAGTTGFTPSSATSGAVTLAGTLATTNGGTGLTSFTANGVVYASSSSALTTGSALTYNGTSLGVGIGAAASEGQLHLNNASGADLVLTRTNGATSGLLGRIRFGNTDVDSAMSEISSEQSGATNASNLIFSTQASGGAASEQMRLTSTGLGIGTSSPGHRLSVQTTSGLFDVKAYGGASVQLSSSAALGYSSATGNGHIWETGGFTNMTLNSSGNLGIGTSSPAEKLEVFGASYSTGFFYTNSNTGAGLACSTDNKTTTWFVGARKDGVGGSIGTDRFNILRGTTAVATFDSSGILGLGVTPSAWGSAYKAIELFFGGGPFTSNAGAIGFTGNCFHNGTNWIYATGNAATRYELGPDGGNHRWFTAPSGTAGNAISFTQAMTLDASGNLLVGGTTSPSGKANNFINLGGSGGFWTKSGGVGYFGTFDNYAMILATNDTERARITAEGFTRPVAYADTVSALGNTGTATTIDLRNANVFTATLTGNCTFTLSNPIATGSSSFTLILTNDGTAGRTVAWAGGSFVFPGGAAALSRTTTANAVDVWVFFTPNGGTTWYGNIAMKDMKA